jgi:hypothetical protein
MGEGTAVAFDERTRTAVEDFLAAFAPNLGATSAATFERRVREIEAKSSVSVEAAKRKT